MSSQLPYAWIKTLPSSRLHLDEVPLVSPTPIFPWQALVEALIHRLELHKLSLSPQQWQWREPQDLFSGLSSDPFLLGIGIIGCEGAAIFACEKRSLLHLVASLLQHPPGIEEMDLSYQEGFLHFLSMEILDILPTLNWENNLQCFLIPNIALEDHPYLSLDITCELIDTTFTARFFADATLSANWKERHRQPFSLSLNPQLAQNLSIPVSLHAGHSIFSYSQWKRVQPGDFILLDACGLDTTSKNGNLTLTVYNLPFFQCQLNEDGTLLLTERSILDEVTTFMAKNDDDDEDFDFDDEDFNLDDDFNFDEAIETEVEEEAPPPKKEAAPTPTPQAAATGAPAAKAPAAQQAATAASSPGKKVAVEKQAAGKVAAAKDIPLTVVVEVGRFEVTVEKLMEMQPGNLLDLNVHPEQGVDLIVNGRRVGRGELLLLGESLGVRVTEL